MRSLVEAHDRIKDFEWEPSYAVKQDRYPTKYKIPTKTKDPFRHLIRDYMQMEREKDDRQYGSMEDALARSGAPAKADPRWMEILKAVLPMFSFGEYAAMKCCGQLIETVENAELRQGYMAQMLDEVRHTNQELYLARYYARHAEDPEGFAVGLQAKGTNLFNRAARAALETFFVGDPIEGALNLQVVTETAYTNPIFVAMTEIASANGDETTPSVFLSIQSDEARHMANGYSTLTALVSEPDNLEMLQEDFDDAFWRMHAFVDPFLGVVYDYFQSNRTSSYKEKWDEWIAEDWIGSYISKLEPFGLEVPKGWEEAKARMPWAGHTAALVAFATWPLHFWRCDPLTDKDMEWFEEKCPGWYDQVGFFWEGYRELADPAGGASTLQLFDSLPPVCRVCQMPTLLPRIDANTSRIQVHEGKKQPFCSAGCQSIFNRDPQRYLAYKTWYELYAGYGLDEYIIENGLLRADGKTLLAQPHLEQDRMWTIDDIKALDYEIKDPMAGDGYKDWIEVEV